MRKLILGSILGATLVVAPAAYCREKLRDKLAERGGGMLDDGTEGKMAERMKSSVPHRNIAYGADSRQNVEFFQLPANVKKPPLVIFVHGGGWRRGSEKMVDRKPEFYTGLGYAFASVGYRMLPDAPVEQQAQDVGAAIRMLRDKARELGFDPDRIILTGHSAGAHLVALLGTDPQYAGSAFGAIRGVMPIDGAGYDVPRQMKATPLISKKIYEPAFGTDPARQNALSPINHSQRPNAASWLMIYSSTRRDSPDQNKALGEALKSAGSQVQFVPLPLKHGPINIELGTSGYGGNREIETWLAQSTR